MLALCAGDFLLLSSQTYPFTLFQMRCALFGLCGVCFILSWLPCAVHACSSSNSAFVYTHCSLNSFPIDVIHLIFYSITVVARNWLIKNSPFNSIRTHITRCFESAGKNWFALHEKYQNNLNTLKIEPIWIPILMILHHFNKQTEQENKIELIKPIEMLNWLSALIFAYKSQMHLILINVWD